MTALQDRVPHRTRFFHGLGSIAYGVKDNGFSTFLLIYYNQVLGMEAAMVSLALMLALLIDAFVDPVIGHLSDRTYTKWGRRLPWLYIAPIPLALAWLLLWDPPALSHGQLFFYLVAVAVVIRALVSCCEVPSVALVPELTPDYDERTVLMRFRYLFGWGGGLLIAFLAYGVFLVPNEKQPVGQLNVEGYWAMGVTGALLIAFSVLVSALGQHKRVAHWPKTRPVPTSLSHSFDEIRESFNNRAFLIFLGGAAFAYISQGVTFSISNYLYLYVWQFSDTSFKIYPAVLLISVIASFFLVVPCNRRWGKKNTAVASAVIGMIFWVTPFLLLTAGLWPELGSTRSTATVFTSFFLSNVFSVMVMISGASMIADIVEDAELKTGRRTEGLFFAGNFFMQKCAVGFGIFVSGLIISWAGLSTKAAPGAVDGAIIAKLTLAYCVIVAVMAICAALVLRHFPIDRDNHEGRLKMLAERATAT